MLAATRQAIEQHALEDYPREACGVVVVVAGKERYVRCANTARASSEFRMAPEDLAAAEDAGDVVAIVHSHPNARAEPSDADRVGCEASRLPWYIVSVLRDGSAAPPHIGGWHRFEPCGYVAPLVGRSFSFGVLDCYTLCRDWYRMEWGLELPDFPREDGFWHRHENPYMDHFAECGFVALHPDIQPQRGDALLMQMRSSIVNHAGIFLDEGRSLFLHHFYGRLSTREVFGGWYRECTRLIVRHRSRFA